ncbi:MAG: ADOP family duplicated permease [Vicinamibacterales bacterium]
MALFGAAARRLIRRPLESLVIVLTLALGIGATTAMFTVVDTMLLRRPPFADADRLVDVSSLDRPHASFGSGLSPGRITGWRDDGSVFEALEGYTSSQVDLTGAGDPAHLVVGSVSLGLFRMLGVTPALGRDFAAGEGRAGSPDVAIISDSLWRERFGGDPDALGRVFDINGRAYTIVGVMPRRFRLQVEAAAWLPVDLDPLAGDDSRQMSRFFGVGRLRAGVSAGEAQRLADARADVLQSEMPLGRGWYLDIRAMPVAYLSDTTRASLLALAGAVLSLLLVALANVANLSLAQAAAREPEFAVHAALGAGRSTLVAQILADALLPGAIAGVAGLVLARWMVAGVLLAAPSDLVSRATTTVEIDTRVLVAAIALSVGVAVAIGVLAAIRGSRPQLDRVLRRLPAGRTRATGRLSGGLIVAEVALSVALLACTALMTRTVQRLETAEPGFDTDRVLAVSMWFATDRYPDETSRTDLLDAVRARLGADARVRETGASLLALPGSGFGVARFETDGPGGPGGPEDMRYALNLVSPDYFRVLGIPMRHGRPFDAQDRVANAVVLSESLAARLFPDGRAVGRRFRESPDDGWQTVVGVAGDVRPPLEGPMSTTDIIYYPIASRWGQASARAPAGEPGPLPRRTFATRTLVVRADQPGALVAEVRSAIHAVDPSLPFGDVQLVSDLYREQFSRQRFVQTLMSAFGALALLLAAAGILAVLWRVVAERTREFAIRSALGATPRDVGRLVMGRGLALAALGAALGVAGGLWASGLMAGLLAGASPRDPLSFGLAVAVLLVTAAAACWLPTRRALSIEPAEALRE